MLCTPGCEKPSLILHNDLYLYASFAGGESAQNMHFQTARPALHSKAEVFSCPIARFCSNVSIPNAQYILRDPLFQGAGQIFEGGKGLSSYSATHFAAVCQLEIVKTHTEYRFWRRMRTNFAHKSLTIL